MKNRKNENVKRLVITIIVIILVASMVAYYVLTVLDPTFS